MPYTTPVLNRTKADVTNKTSKGYFNIADWDRINNNAKITNALLEYTHNTAINFNYVAIPDIDIYPGAIVGQLNGLLANIERIRQLHGLPTTPIKYNWVAGETITPSYIEVNQWENTINTAWIEEGGPSVVCSLSLSVDLTLLTGTQAVYCEYIDTNGHDIDLQGTSKLYII